MHFYQQNVFFLFGVSLTRQSELVFQFVLLSYLQKIIWYFLLSVLLDLCLNSPETNMALIGKILPQSIQSSQVLFPGAGSDIRNLNSELKDASHENCSLMFTLVSVYPVN